VDFDFEVGEFEENAMKLESAKWRTKSLLFPSSVKSVSKLTFGTSCSLVSPSLD